MTSQSTPSSIMSNDLDWDVEREEQAQDLSALKIYDVRRAKRLVVQTPRAVEQLDLPYYKDFFRACLESIHLKPLDQQGNIDTNFPAIFATEHGGRKFLLDGWHRMARALDSDLKLLPIVTLTEEETATICIADLNSSAS